MAVSIVRMQDAQQLNNNGSVRFYVDFGEAVSGVSVDDFALLGTGTGTIASVTQSVGGGDGPGAYIVNVTVGADGTFGLQLKGGTDIRTTAGSLAVDGVSMAAGEFWTVDRAAPTVTSVNAPANATYHAGDQVDFVVNFSEAVKIGTGTPTLGLTLDTGGAVSASLVAGQETSALTFRYTVGGAHLDLTGVTLGSISGGSLVDLAGNAWNLTLSGAAPTSGVLIDGRPYVKSIVPSGPATTNAAEASFIVTFDQSVTGVTADDFTLTSTGSVDAMSFALFGSGASYTVTVSGLSGQGELRLDLKSGGTGIAGAGAAIAGGFTAGQTLQLDRVAPQATTVTMPSAGTYAIGQSLDFAVHFNENVTLTMGPGAPVLEIVVGSTTRHASFVSSTAAALQFSYVVMAGDLDADGITLGAIDLKGATIKDAVGNAAVLNLTGAGAGVLVDGVAPTTVATSASFSSDTGASATDLVTSIASQTVSGTLSAALTTGESVLVSLNNGATWTAASSTVGQAAWSLAGVTLSGSNTLQVVVQDAAGNKGSPLSRAYVLDQAAPTTLGVTLKLSADTGSSSTDFITSTAAQTISGTLSAALALGEQVQVSVDNGANWSVATADGLNWSLSGAVLSTTGTLRVRVVDLAGNTGATLTRAYVVDTTAPTTSGASASFSADSGASSTDLVTNVASQTLSGTLTANLDTGERVEVSLDDGASWATATAATGSATWSLSGVALSAPGTLKVRVVDVAGNSGPAYSTAYVLDTQAPTVAISADRAHLNVGESATITFTFSEAVTGFTLADLNPTGGTLAGFATTLDPKVYTAQFTAAATTATIAISAASYIDIAGNAGAGQSLTFTPAPPPEPTPAPQITADQIRQAFSNAAGFAVDSSKALASTVTLPDGSVAANPAFDSAVRLAVLIARFEQGVITRGELIDGIVAVAAPTSGVALQAYQFFTGSIPTKAGMAWLIDSPDNPNDLTDAYFARFNEVNRFINFAVSLGLEGEGKAAFAARFDTLDFAASTRLVYDMVIGVSAARAAGIDVDQALAWIVSQESYFDAVAGSDLGGKAAMVGYIMQAGFAAQVGRYYQASHDFIAAGFDGAAPYHVDLVGGQHLGG